MAFPPPRFLFCLGLGAVMVAALVAPSTGAVAATAATKAATTTSSTTGVSAAATTSSGASSSAAVRDFTPVPSATLLDTSAGLGTTGTAKIGAGATVSVQVAGRGGIPSSGVGAVVLNVLIVSPSAATAVSVYPSGTARPGPNVLNTVAGRNRANRVITKLGSDGKVVLYNAAGSTHLRVYVSGWFVSGGHYTAQTRQRILDTRSKLGASGPLGAAAALNLQVAGRGGVPASGVSAVALNVSGVAPSVESVLSVYPGGTTRSSASTTHILKGEWTSVLVIVGLGTGGAVALYNSAGSTNLTADVEGWFTTGGDYTPLHPFRILDSAASVDPIGPTQSHYLRVCGISEGQMANAQQVPVTGVSAVVLVVTGSTLLGAGGPTWLSLYPKTSPRPVPLDVSLPVGISESNVVIVPVNAECLVNIYGSNAGWGAGATVDVLGWFAGSPVLTIMGDVPEVGEVSVPYQAPITFQGGVGTQTWKLVSGNLPAGLTLGSDGTVRGTPTAAGSTTATLQAADGAGWRSIRVLTFYSFAHLSHGVWAWGDGAEIMTGSVSFTDGQHAGAVPGELSNLNSVTSVTSNGATGYALRSDGTLWYWLLPYAASSPVVVQRISTFAGAHAIAAAPVGVHVVASDRTLWKYTGTFTTDSTGSITGTWTSAQIPGLTQVTAVASGDAVSYALCSDGTVWSWGVGSHGGLGTGSTADSAVPVKITALSGITAIAATSYDGYALRADGTVWAWGPGLRGELGNGSTADSTVPVQVSGLTRVTAITSGQYTTYALRADGTVWAWGAGQNGLLGNGTTAAVQSTPVQVSGLSGVTAIATAGGHFTSYALTSDGTVWAWGSDGEFGEFGDGRGDTDFALYFLMNPAGALPRPGLSSTTVPIRAKTLPPVSALGGGLHAQTAYAIGTD